jgi:sn-glycerol 3-phosphate transport system ATP-binding protein
MAAISISNVVKRYGAGAKANQVIHGVNAEIADGEFVVIVGPSGCGKSRCCAWSRAGGDLGRRDRDRRRVVNDVEPADRDIAMVFQNYALYPHMTVFDNMAYGLKIAKVPVAEIKTRSTRRRKILELGHLLARKPRELSGGQRQRVAMGRAIVRQPQVSCSTSRCRTSTPSCARRRGSRSRSCTASSGHLAVRHARPGRGDDPGAAHDRDERRPHGADRHARRGLPAPAPTLRRRFIGSPPMNLLEGQADGHAFMTGGVTLALPARRRAAARCCWRAPRACRPGRHRLVDAGRGGGDAGCRAAQSTAASATRASPWPDATLRARAPGST